MGPEFCNPNGVVSPGRHQVALSLGLFAATRFSQGSSLLATLGFETESLWDSRCKKLTCCAPAGGCIRTGMNNSMPSVLNLPRSAVGSSAYDWAVSMKMI